LFPAVSTIIADYKGRILSMQRVYSCGIVVAVGVIIGLGIVIGLRQLHAPEAADSDSSAAFLQQHWRVPIPLQGPHLLPTLLSKLLCIRRTVASVIRNNIRFLATLREAIGSITIRTTSQLFQPVIRG
jgi:hypothetical protein